MLLSSELVEEELASSSASSLGFCSDGTHDLQALPADSVHELPVLSQSHAPTNFFAFAMHKETCSGLVPYSRFRRYVFKGDDKSKNHWAMDNEASRKLAQYTVLSSGNMKRPVGTRFETD